MSFWLATLNPGRKARHHRRRRHKRGCACVVCAWKTKKSGGRRRSARRRHRKLSGWQRMVKKYGGVRAAVKARRALRKSHRKHRKIRRGSARKHTRRRVSRRSLRTARRNPMARTRRRRSRRLPPRGAHGRFKSRRRGGRRRARRNPLFRARRSGRYSRRGSRRLHQIRPGGIGWHNPRRRKHRRHYRRNAVVPVSWNPRRRRHYRRNAVLPMSWNPGGLSVAGLLGRGGPIGRLQSFIDIKFWTDVALPATGGFLGSKVVGGFIYGFVGQQLLKLSPSDASAPFVRAASDAVGGGLLAWAVSQFLRNRKMAESVWLGTVVSVAHTILKTLIGNTDFGRSIGLSGIGSDVSSALQQRVRERVESSLRGYGTYLNRDNLLPQGRNGLREYVNEDALRRQGNYAPTPGGDLRDYDPTRTETAF